MSKPKRRKKKQQSRGKKGNQRKGTVRYRERSPSARNITAETTAQGSVSARVVQWIRKPTSIVITVLSITVMMLTIPDLLHASVTVEPQKEVNPEWASTSFTITNDGAVSVHDLTMSCTIDKATTVDSNIVEDWGNLDIANPATYELKPTDQTSGWCGNPEGSTGFGGTGFDPYSYIDLTIRASYRPSYRLWRTSDDFRFEGFRPDGKGEIIWVPLTPYSEAS